MDLGSVKIANQYTKETGTMTNKMDRELRFILINLAIMVNSKMDNDMAPVTKILQMDPITMASGLMTKWKDMVNLYGRMELIIKANGKMGK